MAELKKNLLRECPFCGSVKIRMWENNWVQCESCWGSTGTYETEEETIHAWNNRPTATEAEIRAKAIDEFKRRLIINFNDWQMSVAEVGNEKEYETIGQAIIGIDEIAEQLKEE